MPQRQLIVERDDHRRRLVRRSAQRVRQAERRQTRDTRHALFVAQSVRRPQQTRRRARRERQGGDVRVAPRPQQYRRRVGRRLVERVQAERPIRLAKVTPRQQRLAGHALVDEQHVARRRDDVQRGMHAARLADVSDLRLGREVVGGRVQQRDVVVGRLRSQPARN